MYGPNPLVSGFGTVFSITVAKPIDGVSYVISLVLVNDSDVVAVDHSHDVTSSSAGFCPGLYDGSR